MKKSKAHMFLFKFKIKLLVHDIYIEPQSCCNFDLFMTKIVKKIEMKEKDDIFCRVTLNACSSGKVKVIGIGNIFQICCPEHIFCFV